MSEPLALLVIGGGPAGFSAAEAFREAGGRGSVGIVSDEGRMPYQRPPLTKELLRGESGEDELPMAEEDWLTEHGVALISGRAVALDVAAREVTLSGGRVLGYVHCLLATGAEPTRPPVPGADDPAVRTVRGLHDVRELLARLSGGERVAVIGSGFIGCEIAASLRMRGHPVALVSPEPAPNAARLGEAAAGRLREWLEAEGVQASFGHELEAVQRHGSRLELSTGGEPVEADLVVLATGVRPRIELAKAAGLTLEDGAITADAALRAGPPGVLAAGDVVKAFNAAAGRALRVEHWGDALGQGKVAGRTAAGVNASWEDVPGFWSTIGRRTLKYAAWGDGFDDVRFETHEGGGFTAWYGRAGRLVGVLAHEADADYEQGQELVRRGATW